MENNIKFKVRLNKKPILIFVLILFIVGVITSQIVGVINTQKTLDKKQIDKIKSVTGIDNINLTISNPICNDDYCLFEVYQENLTNMQFRINVYYLNYDNCLEPERDTGLCLRFERISYTDLEIREQADQYIQERLEAYADALEQRDKLNQPKDIGGRIIFNAKS